MIPADQHLELGTCGMGMPVIKSWQMLKTMPLGSVLHITSAHP